MPRRTIRLSPDQKGVVGPISVTSGEALRVVIQRRLAHTARTAAGSFHSGSSVLLPEDLDDSSRAIAEFDRPTGLAVVTSVLRFAQRFDQRLLVAGHTDAQGKADSNLALSAARAANVVALLRGNAPEWAASCQAQFRVADIQHVYAWVARVFGWPCDPGPVDDTLGPCTRQARHEFRATFEAEFGRTLRTGEQSTDDWAAIYELYDIRLAQVLGRDGPEQSSSLSAMRAALRFSSPSTLGCGEQFAAEHIGEGSVVSAANRRVDLWFFAPDDAPDLSVDASGGLLYGPSARFRTISLPTELGGELGRRLKLTDHAGKVLCGVAYRLDEAGGEYHGITNSEGYIVDFFPDQARPTFLSVGAIEYEIRTANGAAQIDRGRSMLNALGFAAGDLGRSADLQLRQAIARFQREQDLAVNKLLDKATMARLSKLVAAR